MLSFSSCGLTHTLSTGVLTASGSPERSVIAPRCAAILTTRIERSSPCLRQKAVVEQLQLHRARREPHGAQHHESEHQRGPPAVALRLRAAFVRALLHGRTIRTS